LETTQYWKAFYLFPIPLLIIGTILILTVFKQESVNSHAQKNEKNELMALLQKVYKEPNSTVEKIADELIKK
jgi:cytochrome c-type biogenesis protein CcmH/NrfF